MDGRNPNTPEHVDGMKYPDYIISKPSHYHGKITIICSNIKNKTIWMR